MATVTYNSTGEIFECTKAEKCTKGCYVKLYNNNECVITFEHIDDHVNIDSLFTLNGINWTEDGNGFAGGTGATSANGGGAVGFEAETTNGGGVVGYRARAGYGGAVGASASAMIQKIFTMDGERTQIIINDFDTDWIFKDISVIENLSPIRVVDPSLYVYTVSNRTLIIDFVEIFADGAIVFVDLWGNGGAVGHLATTENGGSVGFHSKSDSGGSVGSNSNTIGGCSVGSDASSINGGSAGFNASTNEGAAVGYLASSRHGGAVGRLAKTSKIYTFNETNPSILSSVVIENVSSVYKVQKIIHNHVELPASDYSCWHSYDNTLTIRFYYTTIDHIVEVYLDGDGFAGGNNSSAIDGAAIGNEAHAEAPGAVQLGSGTNSTPNSLQFRDYPIVSADGLFRKITNFGTFTLLSTDKFENLNIMHSDYYPLLHMAYIQICITVKNSIPMPSANAEQSIELFNWSYENNRVIVHDTPLISSYNKPGIPQCRLLFRAGMAFSPCNIYPKTAMSGGGLINISGWVYVNPAINIY